MIGYTGDVHGDFDAISRRIENLISKGVEVPDTIVILGDVGANFHLDGRDDLFKRRMDSLGIDFLCIHGNHECRPQNIPSYHEDTFMGGRVLVEDAHPGLRFAVDGEVYDLDGRSSIVIGGAYSVDKPYRLEMNWPWWSDEQPSDGVKRVVEDRLDSLGWRVDQVLSHTCPYGSRPTDRFDPFVDQSRVDSSTELWLESIQRRLDYDRWLCGHYHVDRDLGGVRLVMDDLLT